MKRNGFTLIELLAVIVILAIIALIATPIILGIINDAREESNERSVELYASAVRNAVAAYQLTNPNAPTNFSDLTIETDGEVECTTIQIYEDGNIYMEGCIVNNGEKEYSYGTKQQVYKPQFYYYKSYSEGDTEEYIGINLPNEAKEKVSQIDTKGYPFYLGFDVDKGKKITEAYVCFSRNKTEYCLKGAKDDTETYKKNQAVLKDAYSDVLDTDACSFDAEITECYADLISTLYSTGHLGAGYENEGCIVTEEGYFYCLAS